MTTTSDFPRFDDPEVDLVHVAVQAAPDQGAVDRVVAAGVYDIAELEWPWELMAVTWLVGVDEPIVTIYSQWSSHPAAATPVLGSLITGEGTWLRRRRTQRDRPTWRRPGCVALARISFDGSKPEQAQRWIDTAFATDFGENDRVDGLLAAHFHASDDGTTMVNLAEWRDATDHRRMMQAAADAAAAGADDPAEEIHTFEGIAETAIYRFRIIHHFSQHA